MKVPLLDLKAQYAPLRESIRAAIDRVCESQHFILGPEVEALEKEVAVLSGTSHAVGVSSGTDALLAALMAVGVGPGDEVLTTPYTFFATAGAVARLGARCVFVDVDPGSCNLDVAQAAKAVTSKTKAIIPVHLFGRVLDIDPLLALGLPVIEDAAQAIGARDRKGRTAGSRGLMGCLSFFPSKNLGAFGDGGMVLTNDAALAEMLRKLRAHGSHPKYYHAILGGNFRLDALQAAILRVKLPHLAAWSAARRANAERYRQLLKGIDGLALPEDEPGHIYNQFVVRISGGRRDVVQKALATAGVGTEVYYPVPMHLQECFRSWGYRERDFPEAERGARETLALPIYPELKEEMLRYVADTLKGS